MGISNHWFWSLVPSSQMRKENSLILFFLGTTRERCFIRIEVHISKLSSVTRKDKHSTRFLSHKNIHISLAYEMPILSWRFWQLFFIRFICCYFSSNEVAIKCHFNWCLYCLRYLKSTSKNDQYYLFIVYTS